MRKCESYVRNTSHFKHIQAHAEKTTESVHPRNFKYGLVIWHTKKGRKNVWGVACGKRGIALSGVKSIECCKERLNDVIVFCASFTVRGVVPLRHLRHVPPPQYCDCGPDWPLLFKVHEI